jgi:hypothetical protein
MALWKTQPALRLYVEPPVRLGEPFEVALEIEASEPVEVEWVDLTLQCVEGLAVGSGKNRVSRSHPPPEPHGARRGADGALGHEPPPGALRDSRGPTPLARGRRGLRPLLLPYAGLDPVVARCARELTAGRA